MPDVAQALEEGDAVALTYCDTRKMAEFVYPLLCIGGKFIASELSREGIPLDASLLPSAAAIFPHLQPSVGVVRRTSAGIEVAKPRAAGRHRRRAFAATVRAVWIL